MSYVEPVSVWISHPVPRQIATGRPTPGAEGLPKFTFDPGGQAPTVSYTPSSFPNAWVLLPRSGATEGVVERRMP